MKVRKTGSRRRVAYDYILQRITSGQIAAGDPLSEIPLANEIGVSRTPVREAINQLVAEGILQEIPGRGAGLAEPTKRDIIELYELREALEVYSVGQSAKRGIRDKELETLGKLVAEVRECRQLLESSGKKVLTGELLKRFVNADLRFHVLLLESAGNERIAKLGGDTRLLIRIFTMRREHHTAPLLEQIHSYHHGILEAVRAGNAPEAMRLLGEHIRLSLEERLDEYESRRQLGA